jgi:hypothetical protein
LRFAFITHVQDSCRITDDYSKGRHRFGNHCTRSYNCIVSNVGHYGGICANPSSVPDTNGILWRITLLLDWHVKAVDFMVIAPSE